jgi:hypothetical protein
MKFLLLFLALAVSNFLYQWLTAGDWHVATERTYFQGVAVLLAWLTVEMP